MAFEGIIPAEASGVDLPVELVVRLYDEVDGVVAIKECSGDARRIPALINAGSELEVLVDLARARAVCRRLLPLARFDMTPKLVQYFKAAQDAVGLAGGPTRPPRLPLTDSERAALHDALAVLHAHAHA